MVPCGIQTFKGWTRITDSINDNRKEVSHFEDLLEPHSILYNTVKKPAANTDSANITQAIYIHQCGKGYLDLPFFFSFSGCFLSFSIVFSSSQAGCGEEVNLVSILLGDAQSSSLLNCAILYRLFSSLRLLSTWTVDALVWGLLFLNSVIINKLNGTTIKVPNKLVKNSCDENVNGPRWTFCDISPSLLSDLYHIQLVIIVMKRSDRQQESLWALVKVLCRGLDATENQRWPSVMSFLVLEKNKWPKDCISSALATGIIWSIWPWPLSNANHLSHKNAYLKVQD